MSRAVRGAGFMVMIKSVKKSLISKLFTSFFVLSLVTVNLVAATAYFLAREALKQSVFDRLSVAVTLKEYQLNQWVANQRQDVLLVAQLPSIQSEAKIILNLRNQRTRQPSEWPGYFRLENEWAETIKIQSQLKKLGYFTEEVDGIYGQRTEVAIYEFLEREGLSEDSINDPEFLQYHLANAIISNKLLNVVKNKPNFREISILTAGGITLFSTNKSLEGKYRPLGNLTTYFNPEDQNIKPTFYISSITGKAEIIFATPILDRVGDRIAVLSIGLNLQNVDDLIRERTGLGDTGETYLVGRLEKENIFISSQLSEEANPSETNPYAQGVSSFAIDNATQSKNGTGLYENYKGIPVIGVYRWLEEQNLALLAEISQEEAFQPARELASKILLVGFISAGGLLIAVYLLSLHIIQPIRAITETATQFAAGQLNLKAPVLSEDEIGFLAIAFNTMASQLRELINNLEHKVKERTAELGAANKEITKLNQRLKAENVRLAAEVEVTRKIQQMILPKDNELHAIPELEISGYMEPADEVGGDYYDILQDGKGNIKIGIGDVTGHGLESGVLMIMAQTAVRTLLESEQTEPKKFLDIVNRVLYGNVERMNSDKNMTLSILDYAQGTLKLSGQHEQMIVVRSHGLVELIDTIDLGFPIGLDAEIIDFIDETIVSLHPGDVVVLYTDGITEAENMEGEQYGLKRLCEIVRLHRHKSADGIQKTVINDVIDYIGQQKIYDDITLLVMKQKQ